MKQTPSEHSTFKGTSFLHKIASRTHSMGSGRTVSSLYASLTVYPTVTSGIHRHTSSLSTYNITDNNKFLHSTNNSSQIHSLCRNFHASSPTSHSLANICATIHNLLSHKSYNENGSEGVHHQPTYLTRKTC